MSLDDAIITLEAIIAKAEKKLMALKMALEIMRAEQLRRVRAAK